MDEVRQKDGDNTKKRGRTRRRKTGMQWQKQKKKTHKRAKK